MSGNDQEAYSEYEKSNIQYIARFTQESEKYLKIENTGRNVSYCFKSEYNDLIGEKTKYTLVHYMQKKMHFYKYLNMVVGA